MNLGHTNNNFVNELPTTWPLFTYGNHPWNLGNSQMIQHPPQRSRANGPEERQAGRVILIPKWPCTAQTTSGCHISPLIPYRDGNTILDKNLNLVLFFLQKHVGTMDPSESSNRMPPQYVNICSGSEEAGARGFGRRNLWKSFSLLHPVLLS